MVCPLFSPRPIATSTIFDTGQSHTSALASFLLASLRAADAATVTRPFATARVSGCDSVAALRRLCAIARSMAAWSLPSVWTAPLTTTRGGVDLAVAAGMRIGLLPLGMAGHRERVLPAKIVPDVDRERQRDKGRILAQFGEQLV